MATLKLEIVTPEAKIYSEDVDMVTLPGVEGEMGIFPNHVPLMTQLVAGEVSVRKGGQNFFLAVGDGFVEVTGTHVSILTDMAIASDQIDEAKAEEARKRAEARLSEKLEGEEVAAGGKLFELGFEHRQLRRGEACDALARRARVDAKRNHRASHVFTRERVLHAQDLCFCAFLLKQGAGADRRGDHGLRAADARQCNDQDSGEYTFERGNFRHVRPFASVVGRAVAAQTK